MSTEATSPRFNCDGCSQSYACHHEVRYKCNDCADFDYCLKCIGDAPLVHPGHSFKRLDPISPPPPDLPADDEGNQALKNEQDSWEPKCTSCVSVTKVLPILFLALHDPRYEGARVESLQVGWNIRISHLIQATQRGCAFCCFALHTFFRESNFESHVWDQDAPWYADPLNPEHDKERNELVEHCMGTLTRLKKDIFKFRVTVASTKKATSLHDFDKITIALSSETEKFNSMADIKEARVFHSAGIISAEKYVCAAAGDPAAKYISSRPPRAAPMSDESIEQVRNWLRTCKETHGDACRPPPSGPGRLPARLIDVSDGDNLKICETGGSNGELEYAALSYCWGGPQEFQTETASLTHREAGFSVADLPQTIQDAVKLTQRIGLQYLWVDSLCIIQDDAADKLREVTRMADIYKNACITISAARADKATEGFLKDRSHPTTKLWKQLVPFPYHLPDLPETSSGDEPLPTLGEAMKLPRPHRGTLWIHTQSSGLATAVKEPVNRRAWCLQEQVLSPRLLSYGFWPTWRCNKLLASDGGYFARDDDTTLASYQRFTNAMLNSQQQHAGQKQDIFRTAQLLETWRSFVEDYSRRTLSIQSDKLPAIAGIAREMNRMTGLSYVAGLWKENLLQDLMWYTGKGQDWLVRPGARQQSEQEEEKEEKQAMQPVPVLPTWSWASVDAPVLYDAVSSDATALATVLDCTVDSDDSAGGGGGSGFETVQPGGKVIIKGPFKELQKQDVMKVLRSQNFAPAPPSSDDVQEWYSQIMDHLATMPDEKYKVGIEEADKRLPSRVFGIILFSRGWSKNRWDKKRPKEVGTCWFGLFLSESPEGGGKYERIGAFWNERSAFLDQEVQAWEEKVVTLV
ncbi:heterokaryon incompatibility protein 6 [Cladorrhinum sp. PSN259]|nr:heterokaryon incompatibility protein 6 [Cladorrhinum sp. PSN259]